MATKRNRSAQAAALSPLHQSGPVADFLPYGLGGRADAARADYGSAAFGEQRRDRSWPRARAAAAPAGTQAVSVPPQGWRLAIHPCPLCRASASRLAPEPAYFTGYRPREHAVARKTFFLKRKAASGTTDAKGLSAAHPASWVQPCKGGRRSCDCVRLQAWRRPVAPLFVRSSQCMLHRYEPDAAGNLLSARADEAEPLVRPDR